MTSESDNSDWPDNERRPRHKGPRHKGPRRWLRRLLWAVLTLFLFVFTGAGIAAIALYPTARAWWDEAIKVADQHVRFEVSHPGWSFPSSLHTAPTPIDGLTPKHLVVEAKARGYQEDCKDTGPGEYCGKKGHEKVVPRSGDALEPIELGLLIGPDGEIRYHLPLEDAPKLLIDAILAAEDREFRNHRGVNLVAMIRAAIANIQGGRFVQGGSTLTMQTVRVMVQRRDKSLERKWREMVMAMALEDHLGKDRILQIYLDFPYLGQRGGFSICGFESAARHYFGKSARQLSLAEAATLAAILPAPGYFAPDRNPDKAKERRDRVLEAMHEVYGYDIKEALATPIATVEPAALPEHYPAYLTATRAWLEARLTPTALYGAGLDVTVGMDIFAQEESAKVFLERTPYLEELTGRKGDGPLQSAGVLLDVNTGLIKAVYGGSDMTSISFNRATQAHRQAGSSFKPLVYALAFNQPAGPDGKPKYTASSTVQNSVRTFKTPQGDWTPRNLGGEYTPMCTLAQGLAWSQNIATASLLDELGGPKVLIEFAKKLGYDTSKFPEEMGLALGQAEVTPLEMAQFAAIVSNGGRKVVGTPVLRAVDVAGIERLGPPAAGPQVLSPEAAALTRELMRGVIDFGTGGAVRGAGPESGYSGPAMGKTGTTDKEKDLWFVGATPVYAAVVWLGYDNPSRLGASASDLAAPLWGWWMGRVAKTEGPPPKWPEEPKIVHRGVCTVTGKYPNPTCRIISAPYLPGTTPHGECEEEHPPPEIEVEDEEMLEFEVVIPGMEGTGALLNQAGAGASSGPGAPAGPLLPGASADASGSAGTSAAGTASGDAAAGSASDVKAEKLKKKPQHYESLWKRRERLQQEREAQEASPPPAPAPTH